MPDNDGFFSRDEVGGQRRVIGGDVLPVTQKYLDGLPPFEPVPCTCDPAYTRVGVHGADCPHGATTITKPRRNPRAARPESPHPSELVDPTDPLASVRGDESS